MTTRNLDALFDPGSVALVGGSNQDGSVGQVIARNLLTGGFGGSIMMVNPHASEICGVRSYKSLGELPSTPDLAVIATPPQTIPQIIADLGARGCRAAVVITAGVDGALRSDMLKAAQPHLLRIVGPNCLGFISPRRGVNASFTHKMPARGGLAFLTQSGAIATSIIDWAIGRGIGFSHIVSLGDMADVDFGDLLDYLALDPDTRAILLYAETITQARKFMSAGRIAARAKPVIVMKGGRSKAGAQAAASHTGALAGADAVYDAAFRRAGMLRVATLRELFDAAETLASGLHVNGSRLVIVTNGGGLGVVAADALEQLSGALATLSPDVSARLDKALPRTWSHGNPVDILGDAHGERYEAALDIIADGVASDAILVMNCPTGVADTLDAARAVTRVHAKHPSRPMIGCWMGHASTAEPRAELARAGIPTYETPDEAVGAFLHLADHARNQRSLFETPSVDASSEPSLREDARAVIGRVIGEGRTTLTEPEAKAVLTAYHIPVVRTHIVATPADAGFVSRGLGGSFALKILSRDITHKTDVGGVRLDLEGGQSVEQAAHEMLERVRTLRPEAIIDGFTVQEMVKRPLAQELLLGGVVDRTFGPCLLFGHGGIATEIIGDRCMGLPPLNAALAQDMIGRTRVARLLAGYRDRPPAAIDAVARTLVALSDMMIDFPEIAELDINPLLADADGVIALDARIIVRAAPADAAGLAIRPYPDELVVSRETDKLPLCIRPIRPEDAAGLITMAQQTSAEDLRLRFHGAVGAISQATAARLSQIDYDREMVLVADMPDGALGGVVRLVFDPNFESAECAILVRSDLKNRQIGRTLLSEALTYARTRGARRVWGDVMTENTSMLDFARRTGGRFARNPADAQLTRVEFPLT